MINNPARINHMTLDPKVMQGHGGQKGNFYEKRIKSLGLRSMVL